MKANIVVWSEIGSTPLTGRIGSYCDELVKVTINVNSPVEAKAKVRELIANTKYASRGHFEMPEWWNQNERTGWVDKR